MFECSVPYVRREEWEQWFLLSADRHWDNPHSDWEMQRAHLDQVVERNAGIIDVGDLFCCIQGKYDPRKAKSCVRPEHNVDNYLDALVTTATDFFEPYAKHFVVIGQGNHETKILKHQETDLTERLCAALTDRTGYPVHNGHYGGWVRFKFRHGRSSRSINLKYFHGHGGGGPVTKGTIQTNRRGTYLPDADIIATGHIHQQWSLTTCRERLTPSGKIHIDRQLHAQIPTYKEEYGDGSKGWHVERGAPPKPVGAYWLRFWFGGKRHDEHVMFDLIEAR